MKLKGKSQAKCKQFGGLNNNKVIVETGEYFRNSQGDIRKATNAPSHDDEEMGEVVDAQSVISASYDQVQKGTRKSSAKERKFAIKSSRQKELMDEVGLEYYKPSKGRLSPSAFVERAAEQTGKIISKYKIDPENYSKYSKNTQQANDALIADLPTMNELYDIGLVENLNKLPKKDRVEFAQYGKIPTSLNGLYDFPQQEVIVPSNNITMQGIDYQVDAFDNNTGEYLTRMNPEENYQFNNVESVREIPVMQFGGRNNDKYLKLLKDAQDEYKKYDTQYQNAKTPSAKKLAELNRNEAYESVQYLSTRTQPEVTEYSGVPWNPLEKKKQLLPIVNPQAANTSVNTDVNQYSGNDLTVTPTKPIAKSSNAKVPVTSSVKPVEQVPVERTVFESIPSDIIRNDATAGQAYMNGSISWDGIQPHMKAPEVGAYIPPKDIEDEVDINADVPIGRINRDMSLNAMRQIMLNNRSVDLPYRTEVPNRTYKYNEIDATPQLNRIAASTNQQLQNVNMNTSQGQAVANAIAARNLGVENQTLNQIGQQNRQIRTQTDNMNVQALNNFDLLQEQANANYTNEVYQTLAARDQAKVQQADLLDQAIRERRNTDNAFTMMNMANPNFKIDPRTGEVVRIKKSFKEGQKEKAARWGFTKRLS